MKKYSQEKLQELYDNLPEELQNALFSQENALNIQKACEKAGIKEKDKISQASEQAGYVILGIINPEEMEKNLIEEAGIENAAARKIMVEITKSVFQPIKETLEALLDTKIEIPKEISPEKEKTEKKDKYREFLE
jgi:hypothetical protein